MFIELRNGIFWKGAVSDIQYNNSINWVDLFIPRDGHTKLRDIDVIVDWNLSRLTNLRDTN